MEQAGRRNSSLFPVVRKALGVVSHEKRVGPKTPGRSGGKPETSRSGDGCHLRPLAPLEDMVFVEVFAGCARLSRAVRRRGPQTQAWDILYDAKYDMEDPVSFARLFSELKSLLKQERLLGVHLAPPCTTWSIARHPMVRSRKWLWGLPHLAGKARAQVLSANRVIKNVLTLIDWLIVNNVPCSVENPQSSRLFLLPFFRLHIAAERLKPVVCHFCQFGEAWRKATTFLCGGLSNTGALALKCSGRNGICSRTQRRHIALSGTHPERRIPWTKVAEPYPVQLCSTLAGIYLYEYKQRQTQSRASYYALQAMCPNS